MQKLHPVLRLLPETVVTPYYAAQDRHRVALIGAERYIHKPPTFEEFIDEVGGAIADMLGGTQSGTIEQAAQQRRNAD